MMHKICKAPLLHLLLFHSLLPSLIVSTPSHVHQPYIVYMGSASTSSSADHLELLSSIIPSEEKGRVSLIHSYENAFKGFSAMLTREEASLLSAMMHKICKAPLLHLFLFHSLLPSLIVSTPSHVHQPYIVYMGSASTSSSADHLELLSSIIPSEEKGRVSLIHSYENAFKGFSAMLTREEASLLSEKEKIVSVFPDKMHQLHTTRSWDFLNSLSGLRSRSDQLQLQGHASSDVIIGMIDTGIWPESPSFNDHGVGDIPSRWKGICMEGLNFDKSKCNRKLIGARYYSLQSSTSNATNYTRPNSPSGSARDSVGHGTHTTSIAAGSRVINASYYGLSRGTARGGSPTHSTRIASYKACTEGGCPGSTILKAFDNAISDGVDIISISIGLSSFFQPDFINDPIAIGAFHAEQNGVLVVCSGGNEGPDSYTVVNTAPWIFTVAASSIDRDYQSTVVLGNGVTLQGTAINFSNLTRNQTYPLAFGEDVAARFTPVSEASNCYPGSLDRNKVAGKIVVCVSTDPSVARRVKKLVAEDAKAKGMILIDEETKSIPHDSGIFPFSQMGNSDGLKILNYLNSTKNPTATILQTNEVPRYKPAPVVAYFSSRGPGGITENILKPDIMAPGVAILGAMIPTTETGNVPAGKKRSSFGIRSGTSMACPHVTGAAAFIKSVHSSWSVSMIRSALMTTAIVSNNMRKLLTDTSSHWANPHETGVGEISPLRALDPGLVFETTTEEYLKFLCYYGYAEKNIQSISNTKFKCPKNSTDDLISNINYPSISISKLDRNGTARIITRTVTNMGSSNATYTSKVHAPIGLVVKVFPNNISFVEGLDKASFKVSFSGEEATKSYNFGYITWSDGAHKVRVVYAVNVE